MIHCFNQAQKRYLNTRSAPGEPIILSAAVALWSPDEKGDPSEAAPDYQFTSVQELSDFLIPQERRAVDWWIASETGIRTKIPLPQTVHPPEGLKLIVYVWL